MCYQERPYTRISGQRTATWTTWDTFIPPSTTARISWTRTQALVQTQLKHTGVVWNATSVCSGSQTGINYHYASTSFSGEIDRTRTTAMTSFGRCFAWWRIISSCCSSTDLDITNYYWLTILAELARMLFVCLTLSVRRPSLRRPVRIKLTVPIVRNKWTAFV